MKGNWLSGTLSRVGQPSVLFDAKPEEQTAINREGTYCIKRVLQILRSRCRDRECWRSEEIFRGSTSDSWVPGSSAERYKRDNF